jgi:hypothetical protein
MTDIEEILKDRQRTHGSFPLHAIISQALKDTCRDAHVWHKLSMAQRESVDMICHKLARVLNGDPNEVDHWRDCEGYAHLITRELDVPDKEGFASGGVK